MGWDGMPTSPIIHLWPVAPSNRSRHATALSATAPVLWPHQRKRFTYGCWGCRVEQHGQRSMPHYTSPPVGGKAHLQGLRGSLSSTPGLEVAGEPALLLGFQPPALGSRGFDQLAGRRWPFSRPTMRQLEGGPPKARLGLRWARASGDDLPRGIFQHKVAGFSGSASTGSDSNASLSRRTDAVGRPPAPPGPRGPGAALRLPLLERLLKSEPVACSTQLMQVARRQGAFRSSACPA